MFYNFIVTVFRLSFFLCLLFALEQNNHRDFSFI